MKKYFQITFFLGLFFLVVFLRNFKGEDTQPLIVGNSNPAGTPSDTTSPASSFAPPGGMMTNMGQTMMYKDGTYTGSVEDAYYGNYQVAAVISGGRITDIQFLQYPNDNRTSISINSQAMTFLKSEALQAQSAQVDIVSGASDSSMAFQRSLGSALSQAK